jgi:hypothetical protein
MRLEESWIKKYGEICIFLRYKRKIAKSTLFAKFAATLELLKVILILKFLNIVQKLPHSPSNFPPTPLHPLKNLKINL